MSQNTQNAATEVSAAFGNTSAVDQGADVKADVTPDQDTETSDNDSNVGLEINEEEVSRIEAERTERASKAALTSYFKQQGLSQKEAEQYFEQHKAKKAAEREQAQNDLGMLQQTNKDLEQQLAAAQQKANNALIKAEAKVAAMSLGVRADRVNHVIRLATLKDVTIDEDGAIDAAAVKAAIEQVLKEIPELKQSEENRPGFKIGGAGQQAPANNDIKSQISQIFGNAKKE